MNAVFFAETVDLLTNILATTSKSFLLTADFNCPGRESNTIDVRPTAVLELFGMVQTVSGPIRDNNLLDILAHNDEESFVNNVQLDDAGCFQSLNGADITSTRLRHLKPVTFSFRRLKQLNFDFFKNSLRNSSLFTNTATSANGFADQLAEVLMSELDKVVPLKTVTCK